jgi:hypothetical protein
MRNEIKINVDAEEEMLILHNEAHSVKTSLSLRPTVDRRLRGLAKKMNVPLSSILERALVLYLDAMGQE